MEENIGDLGVGNEFLDVTPKAPFMKETNWQVELY
jgi:hypothetical protein